MGGRQRWEEGWRPLRGECLPVTHDVHRLRGHSYRMIIPILLQRMRHGRWIALSMTNHGTESMPL